MYYHNCINPECRKPFKGLLQYGQYCPDCKQQRKEARLTQLRETMRKRKEAKNT